MNKAKCSPVAPKNIKIYFNYILTKFIEACFLCDRDLVNSGGKNSYSRLEKERKKMVDKRNVERLPSQTTKSTEKSASIADESRGNKKKELVESAAKASSLVAKEKVTDLIRQTDAITNSVPVIGLPPRIVLGNYTEKVMNNLREVLKVTQSFYQN